MPKPPRIDVLPLVPGEYAKPMRGMKSFFGACGTLNVQHTPGIKSGALAIAFRDCCVQPNGMVRYSYRNPRFRVRLRVTFQLSFTYQPYILSSPEYPTEPKLRWPKSGTKSLTNVSRAAYS